MNLPEIKDHVRLFRSRVWAPIARHEVDRESGIEWRLVRLRTPMWAAFLLGALFVAGCALTAKNGNWIGLGAFVMVAVGMVWWRRKGMREHPDVEVIAKWSDDGETVTFPLVGLEWPIGEVCQLAVRDVALKRSHYSSFSGPVDLVAASGFNECSRLWQCVYVFGEDGPVLLFAHPWDIGNSGFEKALRTFCEAIGKPLMEPESRRHGPTVISI